MIVLYRVLKYVLYYEPLALNYTPTATGPQSHGSLVVVPLLSPAADRTVLGTISVDTLTQTLDSTSTSTNTSTTAFEEHEIHFYQVGWVLCTSGESNIEFVSIKIHSDALHLRG